MPFSFGPLAPQPQASTNGSTFSSNGSTFSSTGAAKGFAFSSTPVQDAAASKAFGPPAPQPQASTNGSTFSSTGAAKGFTFSSSPVQDAAASKAFTFCGSTTPTKITKPATSPPQAPAAPRSGITTLPDGVEGTVVFPSRADASYRFELVAKDEKLHIWLEDRKTKKQWRTAQLAVSDFVQDDGVIPLATFDDYAECFLNCLQASATSQSEFSRDLVAAADVPDAWELQITLKIRVFTTTWTPTYSFLLKPVPLEPMDLLAATVRDQEDQIADLKKQVASLTEKLEDTEAKTQSPLVVRGTLGSVTTSGKLVWKVDGLQLTGRVVFHTTGAIRFAIPGTFVVNVMVQNTNTNNNTTIELQVNGKTVVSCMDSNANGHHHISSIYHVLTVVPEDEISVIYCGNNSAYTGSYITFHELR